MTLSGIRVLVIDDDESVRFNLVAFFEDEGFCVHEAESAEQALAFLRHTEVDVCIVDIRLPGMDGNAFIMKAHATYLEMKFLIHTGSTDYGFSSGIQDIGIRPTHIFRKPLPDMNVLAATVREVVAEKE